ncbi:hypothetical protein JAAARDRAFT_193637 [Jaapia argillacea MUCL 33604]|uniref:F-box domain-containing protein n=1 Tax=Jaapia argillacea MUCL 33604 TaxID=933084 RepID=A0A067PTR7_9AGAM|nr:hypothetical protein JAAARDRAFT_193637 [Jaapia argillacea MUCL 33604]
MDSTICTSTIPAELWNRIFDLILKQSTLRNISLTCQLFRVIAQPLLFRSVSLDSSPGTHRPRIPPVDVGDGPRNPVRRIEWIAGSRFACKVQSLSLIVQRGKFSVIGVKDFGQALVEAFFTSLAAFKGLRGLVIQGIVLDRPRLEGVRLVSSLDSLTLRQCPIVAARHLPKLAIKHITHSWQHGMFTHPTLILDELEDAPSFRDFMYFTEPSRLCSAVIEVNHPQSSITTLPTPVNLKFPALVHLDLPSHVATSPLLTEIIGCFPNVRLLEFPPSDFAQGPRGRRNTGNISPLAPSLLPHLEVYHGTLESLSPFTSSSLRELSIMQTIPSSELTARLEQLQHPLSLESLSFHAHPPLVHTLACIGRRFQSLKHLDMWVWHYPDSPDLDREHSYEILVESLVASLPRSLARIRMRVDFRDPVENYHSALTKELRKRCPGLKKVDAKFSVAGEDDDSDSLALDSDYS